MINRMVFLDADDTLFRGFSLFPVYDALNQQGLVDATAYKNMTGALEAYEHGDDDYAKFVSRSLEHAAQAVRGRTAAEISPTVTRYFTSEDHQWFGYVRPTFRAIGQNDCSVLITAEPDFIAQAIAQTLRFSEYRSSVLATGPGGRLTGEIHTVLGSSQKGKITTEMKSNTSQTAAFGDSEGDIGMLEAVAYPVCIDPKPGLRAIARERGWRIVDKPDKATNLLTARAAGFQRRQLQRRSRH